MTTPVKIIISLLSALVILGLGSSYYFYNLTKTAQSSMGESDRVIAQVGKIILLPEGEIPSVATVDDPEVLKDQPFFASALIGDKVLIYHLSKKAYLYRPSQNKVIEVSGITTDAPVESNEALVEATSTPVESSDATVEE